MLIMIANIVHFQLRRATRAFQAIHHSACHSELWSHSGPRTKNDTDTDDDVDDDNDDYEPLMLYSPVPLWHLQLRTSIILRTLTTSIADTVCSS